MDTEREYTGWRKVVMGLSVLTGAFLLWLAGAVSALVGFALVISGIAAFSADVPVWWAVVALVLGTAGLLARICAEFSEWDRWAVILPVLAVLCTGWMVLGPQVGLFA